MDRVVRDHKITLPIPIPVRKCKYQERDSVFEEEWISKVGKPEQIRVNVSFCTWNQIYPGHAHKCMNEIVVCMNLMQNPGVRGLPSSINLFLSIEFHKSMSLIDKWSFISSLNESTVQKYPKLVRMCLVKMDISSHTTDFSAQESSSVWTV